VTVRVGGELVTSQCCYYDLLEDGLPQLCVVVSVGHEQLAGSHQSTPLKHLLTELPVDLFHLVQGHLTDVIQVSVTDVIQVSVTNVIQVSMTDVTQVSDVTQLIDIIMSDMREVLYNQQ